MAKEITEKPAEFCFPDCQLMQLIIENHFAYADNKCLISNKVHCVHEDACKMWAEKICKNVCKAESCGLKGLINPVVCIPKN